MDMFLLLLAVCCFGQLTVANLIVEAPCGKIQGREATSVKKQSYVAFTNIPYAKPPVGDLRFAKPQPYPKTDRILDATSEKITICPQPVNQNYVPDTSLSMDGVEDCLILNVYVPKLDSKKRKVMVYIHGGGFIMGASAYFVPGTFVVDQDVIMVTINHRLGVLGFLSTEDEASPGNYGLWDQSMGLKWVKDNIAAFGGDAEDITISGESAGGASVTYQCISPYSKGLFSKVVPQSGTSTAVFAKSMRPRVNTISLATDTKCWEGEPTADLTLEQSQSILKCLRTLSFKDIMKVTDFSLNEAKFVPHFDGDFIQKSISQPLQDDAYLESIGFFDRKYMFALNNNEKAFYIPAINRIKNYAVTQNKASTEDNELMLNEYYQSIWTVEANSRLEPKLPSNYVIAKIKEWYQNRFTDPLEEMVSDLAFLIPTYDYLEALSKRKGTDVWLLYFNHFPSYMKGKLRGIPHALDVLYWFDAPLTEIEKIFQVGAQGELNGEDLKVKAMYSTVIGDFMKYGDVSRTFKDQLPFGWPTFDMKRSHYLDFSSEPRIKSHLYEERRNLWLDKVPEWMSKSQETKRTKDVNREEL